MGTAGSQIKTCRNNCPPTWSGHWREWHRGHGCDKDPNLSHPRQSVHWAVTVFRDGEEIVTISHNSLSGRDLSPEDENAIRMAANSLLGFIGKAGE